MKMTMHKGNSEKTICEGFEAFVKYKKSNNKTEQTIKDYEMMFSIFSDFYGEKSKCSDITQDTINDYIFYLQTKPKKQNGKKEKIEYLSSTTIATYIRHLRAIVYYWMEIGYTKQFKITIPTADEEVKEPYSESELQALLKKPDLKKCSFSEYRNWVLTNFFLATGARIETVRNIRIEDLNFVENEIYYRHVKNRKQYAIPMSIPLRKILQEYLVYRKGETKDYLFCNENDDKKPLTNESVKTVMYRYNQRRGVTKTSMHRYRNTFAKFWILEGGDLIRLQKILGHKRLDMVLKYVDMYSKDLQKDFDSFNPLSAFAKGEHVSIR